MRSSDQTPTPEGIASLVEHGLISPQDADLMRAGLALQGKLPAGYAVSGYSDPWFIVVKSWDGKKIEGDVSREITSALTGLDVRGPRFEDGSLIWAVQGPETGAEKPALTEGQSSEKPPPAAGSGPSEPARAADIGGPTADPTRGRPTSGRSG